MNNSKNVVQYILTLNISTVALKLLIDKNIEKENPIVITITS